MPLWAEVELYMVCVSATKKALTWNLAKLTSLVEFVEFVSICWMWNNIWVVVVSGSIFLIFFVLLLVVHSKNIGLTTVHLLLWFHHCRLRTQNFGNAASYTPDATPKPVLIQDSRISGVQVVDIIVWAAWHTSNWVLMCVLLVK